MYHTEPCCKDTAIVAAYATAFAGFREPKGQELVGLEALPSLAKAAANATAKARAALAANPNTLTNPEYRAAKAALPAITAGVFTDHHRLSQNLMGFGLLILDYDAPPCPKAALDGIKACPPPHLISAFRTGKGVRLIFKAEHAPVDAPPAAIAAAYAQAVDYLSWELSTPDLGPLDGSSRRPWQAQSVWFDEQAYWNLEAEAFEVPDDWFMVAQPVDVEAPKIDLAAPDFEQIKAFAATLRAWPERQSYNDWKALTIALANVYGKASEDLAVSFARVANGQWHPASPRCERETRALHRRACESNYTGGVASLLRILNAAGAGIRAAAKAVELKTTTLNVDRYLSESGELRAILDATKSVVIKAPTGTGKTTYILSRCAELVKDYKGTEIVAFVVPRAYLAQDVTRDAVAAGLPVVDARGGVNRAALEADFDSGIRIFICTADALEKIRAAGLCVRYLIIDESHDLADAAGYRSRAMGLVQQAITESEQVVYLTATPQQPLLSALAHFDPATRVVDVHRTTGPEYCYRTANGTAADLVQLIRRNQHKPGLVCIDLKGKASKGVYPLAAQLSAIGIEAYAATAADTAGLDDWRAAVAAGRPAWLVATNVAAMGYNVAADGLDCVAIHWLHRGGLNAALLAQCGGRFRNAKSVELVCFAGAESLIFCPSGMRPGGKEFDPTAVRRNIQRQVKALATTRSVDLDCEGMPAGGRIKSLLEAGDGSTTLSAFELARREQESVALAGGVKPFVGDLQRYIPGIEEGDLIWTGDADPLSDTAFDVAARWLDRAWDALPDVVAMRWALNAAHQNRARAHRDDLRFVDAMSAGDVLAALKATIVELRGAAQAQRNAKAAARAKASGRKARQTKLSGAYIDASKALAALEANPTLFGQWLDTRAADFAAIAAFINAQPACATFSDALSLFKQLPKRRRTQAIEERAAFAYQYMSSGGVGVDMPAESLYRLPQAIFFDMARKVQAAIHQIVDRAGGQALSGAAWLAHIRELTGIDGLLAADALAILRVLCRIESETITVDGVRTTAYRIVAVRSMRDYRLSYDPRAALRAEIARRSGGVVIRRNEATQRVAYPTHVFPAGGGGRGAPPPEDAPF